MYKNLRNNHRMLNSIVTKFFLTQLLGVFSFVSVPAISEELGLVNGKELEIKGFEILISEKTLLKRLPMAKCQKSKKNLDRACLVSGKEIPKDLKEIGSAKVSEYEFFFYEDQLLSIVVWFPGEHYTSLLEALGEKYGKPNAPPSSLPNGAAAIGWKSGFISLDLVKTSGDKESMLSLTAIPNTVWKRDRKLKKIRDAKNL